MAQPAIKSLRDIEKEVLSNYMELKAGKIGVKEVVARGKALNTLSLIMVREKKHGNLTL